MGPWQLSGIFELAEMSGADGSVHLRDTSAGDTNETLSYSLVPAELAAVKGKTLRFSAGIKLVGGDGAIGVYCFAGGKAAFKWEKAKPESAGRWREYSVETFIPPDAVAVSVALGSAPGWRQTGEAYFSLPRVMAGKGSGQPGAILGKALAKPAARPKQLKPEDFFNADDDGSRLYIFNGKFFPLWSPKGVRSCTEGIILKSGETFEASLNCAHFSDYRRAWYECNRFLDLSGFLNANGHLEIYLNRPARISVCGVPAAADAKAVCVVPLKTLETAVNLGNLGKLEFKLSAPPAGVDSVVITKIAFTSRAKLTMPEFRFKDKEADALAAKSAGLGAPVEHDVFARPEIRDGTFYLGGRPVFFAGPWVSNGGLDGDFGEGTFREAAAADFCNKPFDKNTGAALGISSVQISSAPRVPAAAALGLPTRDFESFEMSPDFFKNLGGMPVVLDFAWIGEFSWLLKREPSFPAEAFQHNNSWHEYIPFCPEHPLGKKLYTEYMRLGAYYVLKNGGNPYLYELFNESAYNCRCDFNKREFLGVLQRLYGSAEAANKAWASKFESLEDAVFMKDQYESCPGLWVDWCKFTGSRYASLLKELSASIREVDKRDNVYFTEQLSAPNILCRLDSRGDAMDYTKIAGALDVLAVEGSYRFGGSPACTGDPMFAALETASAGNLTADLYTALSKGKKPVVNNEHYCIRRQSGKRVPSKRSDLVTAMWCEVFHGMSASYVFGWNRRAYEWRTFEEAKKSVLEGGTSSTYKQALLLNPYNYPADFFKGFGDFSRELEPLRETALPMPRLKTAKVAVVHSYPTLRLANLTRPEADNERILKTWYSALLGGFCPFEFIFEEDIKSAKDLERYQALVIPCMKNSYSGTMPALAEYAHGGGVVICGKWSFLQDEFGKPLDASAFLGLRKKPLPAVREKLGGMPAMLAEEVSPISAKALLTAESGAPLIFENVCGKGKVISFACDLPANALRNTLSDMLKHNGIENYLDLDPADGAPLDAAEAQIIDRGETQLIMLVNWANEKSRSLKLKIRCGIDGSSVVDPVSGAQYAPDNSGRLSWSQKELADGILLTLPPQTRKLFLLRKGPAKERASAILTPEAVAAAHQRALTDEKASLEAMERELREETSFNIEDESRCVMLDLRNIANTGFQDETAEDKKGGWFDQGANDLRNMPTGPGKYSGVPFMVIDPAENNGKSAVVLRGAKRPCFPEKAEGALVGHEVKSLYFLHAAAWDATKGEPCLFYKIVYEDGATAEIPVKFGVDIGGWWKPEKLPEARVAFSSANAACDHVGLYCFKWDNPRLGEKIKSLDIVSANSGAVPVVVAITAEKPRRDAR